MVLVVAADLGQTAQRANSHRHPQEQGYHPMQHIHILGICGTFMGSLAQLAKAKGMRVTGSDAHVYPPMSDQLEAAGIELIEGFGVEQLDLNPDLIVVGNVISRGNPVMEAVLNRGLHYVSGPQWLAETILRDKWVLGVAGTHGKTTTTSMLTWILQYAGFEPGYLIGGVPQNFEFSARLGESDFFVIEADEYDSAFFDKRSKFVHYRPRTLIMNNLEFDHADIFADLAAIQKQFHHLIRTVPGDGMILYPAEDAALQEVLEQGCWTPCQTLFGDWQATQINASGSEFAITFQDELCGTVSWNLVGRHNIANALAAAAAARHVGVEPHTACEALSQFVGVKRRLELLAEVGQVSVFDDFAHHPTAIATTLEGMRARYADEPITAIIEPRSNTMKMGVHQHQLQEACRCADKVFWLQAQGQSWSLRAGDDDGTVHRVFDSVESIIADVVQELHEREKIVIMSNGGFAGIHQRLVQALRDKSS